MQNAARRMGVRHCRDFATSSSTWWKSGCSPKPTGTAMMISRAAMISPTPFASHSGGRENPGPQRPGQAPGPIIPLSPLNHRRYDAHNHLQDERLGNRPAELLAACRRLGITRLVVNGVGEADWPRVLALARQFPEVLPSFVIIPGAPRTHAPLARRADSFSGRRPSAIGEIGLDRWKPGWLCRQEEVFTAQLRLAAQRNLPVSLHCLQAWAGCWNCCRPAPARPRFPPAQLRGPNETG